MAHDPRPLRAPRAHSSQAPSNVSVCAHAHPVRPTQPATSASLPSLEPHTGAIHRSPSGRFREGVPATVAGMHIDTTNPTARGVDPDELDRHIAEVYRDVANEADRDLHFPTGRPLAEALGYATELLGGLPAEAVNSFAGVGYHLGLAHLLPGERVLDLGSGSGTAAAQVGPGGSVTGVDITPEQVAKSERLRREEHVRFQCARIEELPFEDGSFDAVISNGVVNLSADKRRVFAEAARVLRPGGRLALADIVTERRIAARTSCQADLWAACIAGASQRDLYLADIAAAGLELHVIRANPDYRFTSERAQRTSHKYGAHSVSMLALKPLRASRHTSHPDLGSGADVAHAAWEEGFTNTTTTQEVTNECSHRNDPQRRGHRETVRDAGSDQGAAGAGEVPVPRHQPLDRRVA